MVITALQSHKTCALECQSVTYPQLTCKKDLAKFVSSRLDPEKPIARFEPGVLIKYGRDREEEVRVLDFIHGKLSFRTPRVLYHPPYRVTPPLNPFIYEATGVWYFIMEELPGVPLETVIDEMTPEQLDHVADQLSCLLTEFRSLKSTSIGSVTGGPFKNVFFPWPYTPESPWSSVDEYISYYRDLLSEYCAPDYVDELLACLPRDASVHLIHGDLLPRNILVDGSTVTAILDWEFAGHYPDFWEYARMHHRGWKSPGWDHVLARLFPGPYQEELVNTVDKIISLLKVNCSID
ncbi:kinase-like protein [Peniophora sp. CONT]|nr:kinase-like protein [Peniophora sp. CONT]